MENNEIAKWLDNEIAEATKFRKNEAKEAEFNYWLGATDALECVKRKFFESISSSPPAPAIEGKEEDEVHADGIPLRQQWKETWDKVLAWHTDPVKMDWLKKNGKGIPHPGDRDEISPTPPAGDTYTREEVKLILSQRESYFQNHNKGEVFLTTGQWLDKNYTPGLHLLTQPAGTDVPDIHVGEIRQDAVNQAGAEGERPEDEYADDVKDLLKILGGVPIETALEVAKWVDKKEESLMAMSRSEFQSYKAIEDDKLSAAQARIAALEEELACDTNGHAHLVDRISKLTNDLAALEAEKEDYRKALEEVLQAGYLTNIEHRILKNLLAKYSPNKQPPL